MNNAMDALEDRLSNMHIVNERSFVLLTYDDDILEWLHAVAQLIRPQLAALRQDTFLLPINCCFVCGLNEVVVDEPIFITTDDDTRVNIYGYVCCPGCEEHFYVHMMAITPAASHMHEHAVSSSSFI